MSGWNGRRIAALQAAVFAERGRVCHLCGRPGADTLDHIIPRSKGGTDELDNLMPAHKSCNSRRGAMDLERWFERHPITDRQSSREWLDVRAGQRAGPKTL